jgi:hypothetical protein
MGRVPTAQPPVASAEHPSRHIVCQDAFEWLRCHPASPGMSIVTSLPDVSELAGMTLESWSGWCSDTARLLLEWLLPSGVAIFYQSDIRRGAVWVDKAYLVQRGAERAGGVLLWHRIGCRKAPGTPSLGRASYSHLLCFARAAPAWPPRHPLPDVLPDLGAMSWSRGMGSAACALICRYLVEETTTTTVVDPFCGEGTLLAVANAMGLAAVGIDRSPKRCQTAREAGVPS